MYDGRSNLSQILGNYCGEFIPPNHISSTNVIFIQFESDESGTNRGFKMEYNPTGK